MTTVRQEYLAADLPRRSALASVRGRELATFDLLGVVPAERLLNELDREFEGWCGLPLQSVVHLRVFPGGVRPDTPPRRVIEAIDRAAHFAGSAFSLSGFPLSVELSATFVVREWLTTGQPVSDAVRGFIANLGNRLIGWNRRFEVAESVISSLRRVGSSSPRVRDQERDFAERRATLDAEYRTFIDGERAKFRLLGEERAFPREWRLHPAGRYCRWLRPFPVGRSLPEVSDERSGRPLDLPSSWWRGAEGTLPFALDESSSSSSAVGASHAPTTASSSSFSPSAMEAGLPSVPSTVLAEQGTGAATPTTTTTTTASPVTPTTTKATATSTGATTTVNANENDDADDDDDDDADGNGDIDNDDNDENADPNHDGNNKGDDSNVGDNSNNNNDGSNGDVSSSNNSNNADDHNSNGNDIDNVDSNDSNNNDDHNSKATDDADHVDSNDSNNNDAATVNNNDANDDDDDATTTMTPTPRTTPTTMTTPAATTPTSTTTTDDDDGNHDDDVDDDNVSMQGRRRRRQTTTTPINERRRRRRRSTTPPTTATTTSTSDTNNDTNPFSDEGIPKKRPNPKAGGKKGGTRSTNGSSVSSGSGRTPDHLLIRGPGFRIR